MFHYIVIDSSASFLFYLSKREYDFLQVFTVDDELYKRVTVRKKFLCIYRQTRYITHLSS